MKVPHKQITMHENDRIRSERLLVILTELEKDYQLDPAKAEVIGDKVLKTLLRKHNWENHQVLSKVVEFFGLIKKAGNE